MCRRAQHVVVCNECRNNVYGLITTFTKFQMAMHTILAHAETHKNHCKVITTFPAYYNVISKWLNIDNGTMCTVRIRMVFPIFRTVMILWHLPIVCECERESEMDFGRSIHMRTLMAKNACCKNDTHTFSFTHSLKVHIDGVVR